MMMNLLGLFLLMLPFMLLLGTVGPTYGADGSAGPATGRQSKDGSAVVTQSHGKYYEAASRGAIYCTNDGGAGIGVQVTNTTTGNITLSNPVNSKVRLSLLRVAVTYFSGTLGAGTFYHGKNDIGIVQPSSGSTPTISSAGVGLTSAAAPVGVVRTAPTVVAAVLLYAFGSMGPILATTVEPLTTCFEDVDGLICLDPGTSWALVGVFGGTGSTPKCGYGLIWEEIPFTGTNG